MIEVIFEEMTRGNFSFLILIVGVLQLVLMLLTFIKRKERIMERRKYKVAYDGTIVARDMELDDAIMFMVALANKYFKDMSQITLMPLDYPEQVTE